jgi:hypothetical protein
VVLSNVVCVLLVLSLVLLELLYVLLPLLVDMFLLLDQQLRYYPHLDITFLLLVTRLLQPTSVPLAHIPSLVNLYVVIALLVRALLWVLQNVAW